MRPEQSNQPPRRGAIGVIVRADSRLLVIERSQQVRAPGKFCFPGGEIERGESEEDAVKRELVEELNVVVRPIRRVWQSETHSGVQLMWWLTRLLEDQTPQANPQEVARYFWMHPEEIMQHQETLLSNRRFLTALASGRSRFRDADYSHVSHLRLGACTHRLF